jgi:UDP-N-acetylglucosamine 2-epimerase (non-hydrolysing)
MEKKKILIVFGTRPEAIKMAPLVIRLLEEESFETRVCVTAQHREMLDMVLDLFNIKPDFDLNLMSKRQTITDITTRVLAGMEEIILKVMPDLILVHGDTTTTMATALAAFYQQIPVGHVEAGLRSGNDYSPYPEEMNRKITGNLAKLHFAPTKGNEKNLLAEGVNKQDIFVTGNTVIDALHMVIDEKFTFPLPLLNNLDYQNNKVILLTAHRRENWGAGMQSIFRAARKIIEENLDTVLIYPVHLNPRVKDDACNLLSDLDRIHLIPPLDYAPFANLMARSYLVLTDSGGIQEEAPALGKPVLVLRKETERPEAVEAGTVKIAGINKDDIYRLTQELLEDPLEYERIARAVNPYGDGKAAERILDFTKKWLLSNHQG